MSPRVLLVVLVSQTCGGLTPIWTKLALGHIEPWTLVAARQLLGVLVLWALSRVAGGARPARRTRFSRRDWGLLLVLAWGGFALPQVLLAVGIERSTGTAGALLSPLEPIAILAGGMLVLGEPLGLRRLLSVALGTLGAAAIVLEAGFEVSGADALGNLLIALGHASWAIYTLAAKPLLARHASDRVSIASVALGLPPVLLLAATEPFDAARAATGLFWVAVLALLSTGLGTWTWNRALHHISAGTMAAFIFVQPLVGLLAGVWLLDEPVGWLALAGALSILLGVGLAALQARGPRPPPPQERAGAAPRRRNSA
jgi:drug/metabolite transporter (DMT)-like permease